MENGKQELGGSSSSSFTENLFGPRDASACTSASGLFGSVFGPPSTEFGSSYGSSKHVTPDGKTQRNKGEKERNLNYQTQTVEPSYLSSSIYYGGQEAYPPTRQPTHSQHAFKRDGAVIDPDGSSASRGNWWQGSLYY